MSTIAHPETAQASRHAKDRRWRIGDHLAGMTQRLAQIRKDIRVAEWFIIIQTVIILWPVYEYLHGAPDRRIEKQFQAWQLIAISAGKSADGGRREALQDLYSDRVALHGVDLAGALIDSLALPRASLKLGNVQNATFRWAQMEGASLSRVTGSGVKFINARLPAADMSMAQLDSAVFNGSALCTALFIGSSLRGAQFLGANVQGVDFSGADLTGAVFSADANPDGITFKDANIANLRAPEAFVGAALRAGAVVMRADAWRARRAALEESLKTRWRVIPDPADSLDTPRIRSCAVAGTAY